MRRTWEGVWMEREMVDEEQDVSPTDQHRHGEREDET